MEEPEQKNNDEKQSCDKTGKAGVTGRRLTHRHKTKGDAHSYTWGNREQVKPLRRSD